MTKFKRGDVIQWTDFGQKNLAKILKISKTRYLLRFIVTNEEGFITSIFDKRIRKKTVHKFNPTLFTGA